MKMIEIPIRSIQHYLYCPHRWGLLEIDRAWSENIFVTKANIMHERVHNPNNHYLAKGKKIFTSIPVFNDRDEYYIYGITDCIEIRKSPIGISIQELKDRYDLCIVEYKPTKPKKKEYNYEDLMQVFAQKLCVDYVFGCDCKAVIYYADVKKRIELPLSENFEEYDFLLKNTLCEMRNHIMTGMIPKKRKNQYCGGCSLKDICMPSIKKTKSIRNTILELVGGERN